MKITKHPSGRPIHKQTTKGRPLWRIPDKGPVLPRLQHGNEKISAIGFHVIKEHEDDDWG